MTNPYQTPIQMVLDDMQARIEARRKNFSGVGESRPERQSNVKSPGAGEIHPSRKRGSEPSDSPTETNLSGIGCKPAEASSEDTRPNGSVLMPPVAQDQFTPAEFMARIKKQMGVGI